MSGGMAEEREAPEEAAAASVQGTATERPTAAPEEAPAVEGKAAIEPAAAPPEEPEDDGSMSLIAHLTELRARLIKCLIAVALGSCVGYYFLDEIMHYLTLPAGKLYYMQPSEAFFTYLKVAIAAGFLLALPVIFYQVWRFILPALTRAERMVLGPTVPSSVLLFFGGLAFSFFLVLPAAVQFFMGFGNAELEALFSVDKYFDFVIWFVLPFGANVREAVVMCCLAPIAVFSTLFTDEVLGNAKLAGFSLSVSAIIGLVMMTGAHFLLAAIA